MTTVAPEFTKDELRASIEAEAKRWERKVMEQCAAQMNGAAKPTETVPALIAHTA